MYVACSTLCFGAKTLPEALRTIRELGIHKVDLAIHAEGPHLRPPEVAADAARIAAVLRAANLSFAAFHLDPGEGATPEEVTEAVRAAGRLARTVAAPLITVPPGPIGGDFDAEVKRLCALNRAATAEGVILCVETHSAGLTADPAGARELCRRVPGLGLTFDPSHYLVGPHKPDSLDELYPLIRHVRVRDTGPEPGQFQLRIGQGQVEFGRIISRLERAGYNRVLAIDIHDVPDSPFPVMPEVRKLKYLLESMV